MDGKRIAVTLSNGRSHVLDLPGAVAAEDAAAVIRGERAGSEIGWELGDGEWLPYGGGYGWARKSAVAELALVDYASDEEAYGDQIYG